jgi:hypothetical protein
MRPTAVLFARPPDNTQIHSFLFDVGQFVADMGWVCMCMLVGLIRVLGFTFKLGLPKVAA